MFGKAGTPEADQVDGDGRRGERRAKGGRRCWLVVGGEGAGLRRLLRRQVVPAQLLRDACLQGPRHLRGRRRPLPAVPARRQTPSVRRRRCLVEGVRLDRRQLPGVRRGRRPGRLPRPAASDLRRRHRRQRRGRRPSRRRLQLQPGRVQDRRTRTVLCGRTYAHRGSRVPQLPLRVLR